MGVLLWITFSILLIAIILVFKYGLYHLFLRHCKSMFQKRVWQVKGSTPGFKKGWSPQGLTWVKGKLIFANSWKNKRSRVYKINPRTMKEESYFDMPPEAVHTSGLCWDGKFLWAVDYKSNKGYKINLNESFKRKKAKVVGSFETGLKGTSACCIVPYGNSSKKEKRKKKKFLAISDYMNSGKTYFVDQNKALKNGNMKKAIVFSYENEDFSQGLEFIDGYIYESENKIGRNVINKICLKDLKRTRNSFKSTTKQYCEPSWAVEDLCWDGTFLWTSDEVSKKFYRIKL